MTNTSGSLSFTQDMALVQMFSKEEVFSTALPMMWKEKITNSKTPTPGKGENRAAKRKLYSGSNSEDEDKKGTPKRRKDSLAGELSPTGLSKPRTPVTSARLTVPLSERQQMALLMQMTAEKSNQPNDVVLHYPVTPTSPHSVQKRTPSDRKVNKRNERGETPLHLAAIRGDVKAIKKLIKSGVDVNIKDYAGWTPLHEACNHGWMDIAKQLLKAGANVNAQGFEDDLPLHDAAINGHLKLVELLLRHGADPLRQNLKGKSPLDVAANKEIVKLMRSEVVASTSSSSSIADVRSPTSPESNNSDDLEHPKLLDSASEMGLLAVRHRSTSLHVRSWDSEIGQSTNHWNGTSVCLSTSPNGAALPVNCSLSQPQISAGLSPSQVQSSTAPQAAYSTGTSSTFHSSSSSLAAGVSKKVQVSHYMDRSSSSPRLTLKFRHIKQKDCRNKLAVAKNTAEEAAKLTASPGYCSYRVSVNTDSERLDGKSDNRPAADRFTPVSDVSVGNDARTLWNGGCSANARDCAGNAEQARIRCGGAGKSCDAGPDANDKSTPFSSQFEDISDAEDDRPSKPLDIGSATKMFGLSQLSQHIPSASAVYQCHPNSGTIFYDGNGPASMSSLPLLSGLSWNYSGYPTAISAASGNQFSLPLPADRARAQPGPGENSAYPSWGQGNGPSRSIPSVKTMLPLSIDTSVVGRSQACAPGEKHDSSVGASDLLISMPHSSTAGSTLKPCDKVKNHADEQKYFIKSELPKNDDQQLEVTKSLSKFLSPEKTDADPLAIKIKMSPTDGYKKDSITESKVESKVAVLNRSFDVKPAETCSSEGASRKLEDSAETELSGRAAMSGTENSVASSKTVSNGLDCDASPIDTEGKPEIARLTPDLNRRTPSSCGQELLENSNPSSGESLNSVLRVPPLKIIIPPKNGAVVDKDLLNAKMASSTKSNLPYIVNILQDSMVESSSSDSASIELSAAKDSGVCTLPEPVLMENTGQENSSVDPKDSTMSRKRKFKTSCKGLGRDRDRDTESANGETASNCDSREFAATKGGGSCYAKDPNDLKPEEKADAKDKQQIPPPISGMERRMTRSAMRSQQQKGQHREKHSSVAVETTLGPAKMDASCHVGTDKENRDSHSESAAGGKSVGDAVEEEAVYCPRKHKAKHRQLQQQQDQSTVESHVPVAPPQALKRPTNPYEIYMKFKKKVAERKNRLSTLIPKLPATYSNFMMVQCHYNLHKDRTKQDDLKLASPSDLPEALKGLFDEQEQKRHQLRMQHVKERERLVILAEQETLRVQGRAARAVNGHGIALSASALLCTEEAHCCLYFDQDDKDQRSRYNGRQLKSWMDEIQEKFTIMKTELLSRHRLEADILHSIQKLDWEWKMKEVGSCDYHSTPAINELLVPTVTVGDNLDLPGT